MSVEWKRKVKVCSVQPDTKQVLIIQQRQSVVSLQWNALESTTNRGIVQASHDGKPVVLNPRDECCRLASAALAFALHDEFSSSNPPPVVFRLPRYLKLLFTYNRSPQNMGAGIGSHQLWRNALQFGGAKPILYLHISIIMLSSVRWIACASSLSRAVSSA